MAHRKSLGTSFWAALSVMVMLIYALSIGPSMWALGHFAVSYETDVAVHDFYLPVFWLVGKTQSHRLLWSYVGRWTGPLEPRQLLERDPELPVLRRFTRETRRAPSSTRLAQRKDKRCAHAHQLMLDKFSKPAAAYPVYGGVAFDADVLRHVAEPPHPAPSVTALVTCLMVVDLPLTLVGDTLLLPRWLVSRLMGYSPADRRYDGRPGKTPRTVSPPMPDQEK